MSRKETNLNLLAVWHYFQGWNFILFNFSLHTKFPFYDHLGHETYEICVKQVPTGDWQNYMKHLTLLKQFILEIKTNIPSNLYVFPNKVTSMLS